MVVTTNSGPLGLFGSLSSRLRGQMIGAMESSGKVVATMVAVFLVVGGAVMLSIARLAGIITWPP